MSMNPYILSLIEKIENSKDKTSISEWVCENTTLSGRPFSFKRHAFQKQIMDDLHPDMSVIKLSQVGLTEVEIRKALAFLSMNQGRNLLYSFPDTKMRDRNSKTRFKPIIDRDFPKLKDVSVGRETRSSDVMQLGDSFLFITGNSEGEATSTPVDVIFNDEVDLSDQEMLSLFKSRYQHSDLKIQQKFSTPTFNGFGIAQDYDVSDQHEFFYKCKSCNHWHIPKYDLRHVKIPGLPRELESILDIDTVMAASLPLDYAENICPKCGKVIHLEDEEGREWVPTYPTRIHNRGYKVRPFSSPLLSIKYLVKTMADYTKKGHIRRGINTVLGEAYESSNARIEESDINAVAKSPYVPSTDGNPVFIGIDMGLTCTICLYYQGNLIYFKRVVLDALVTELDILFSKFNIKAGCIDRYPYTDTSNRIRDKYNGIIQPVVYAGTKDVEPKYEVDKTIQYYNINRTNSLDRVWVGIKRKEINLFGYQDDLEILTQHFRDMVRDDEAGKEPEWKKLNGNDHYFHAAGYAITAEKLFYVNDFLTRPKETPNEALFMCGPMDIGGTKKIVDNNNIVGYTRNQDVLKTISKLGGY